MKSSSIAMITLVNTLAADVFVTILGKVLDIEGADKDPSKIGVWLSIFAGTLNLLAGFSFIIVGLKYRKYRIKIIGLSKDYS